MEASPDGSDLAPLAEALVGVGDRWTLLVVAALAAGPGRFGELQQAVAPIAANVLSDRLRRLERAGLVLATPYSDRPPRFAYELTAAGRDLAAALRPLADWGARHGPGDGAPRHAACDTEVEARWWCPTCARPVEDLEAEDLHFA